MPFTIDAARAHITEVHWQFAKTMPRCPHEYTVREWRPDLEREFFAFVDLIRRDGVVKPWPRDSPRLATTSRTWKSTAGITGAWGHRYVTPR